MEMALRLEVHSRYVVKHVHKLFYASNTSKATIYKFLSVVFNAHYYELADFFLMSVKFDFNARFPENCLSSVFVMLTISGYLQQTVGKKSTVSYMKNC